jgi:hypothetical protein
MLSGAETILTSAETKKRAQGPLSLGAVPTETLPVSSLAWVCRGTRMKKNPDTGAITPGTWSIDIDRYPCLSAHG